MLPEALRRATPSWLSRGSPSVGDSLLQERLRLFGGIAFLISAAFQGVGQVLVRLGRENPQAPAGQAAMLAILVLMGGTWLYCRGAARPQRALRVLDVLLILTLAGLSLAVPSGSVPELHVRGMVMLLAVNLILYARAIFIPSSALRTFTVSAIAALPLVVYSVTTEDVRFSVWKVMWLLAAISIATAGSAVIYGLRREVSHARQLGQYTLEEKLGEGGMGVVYRARHAMLRRPTAIKLLKPEQIGEAGLRRFEREVQLTAGLSHPNTVTIFDYGRTPDGVFYYAMELLEGLGLDRLVAIDGPQPPGRAAHVLRQVLEALAEAHGVGLVHRDVKPANIILCERGGVSDVAKVVDFGLVKDLEGETGVTHDGAIVGTPLYLVRAARKPAAAGARGLGASVPREGPGAPPRLGVRGRPGPRALRPRGSLDARRRPRLVGGEGPGARFPAGQRPVAQRLHALTARHRARGLTSATEVAQSMLPHTLPLQDEARRSRLQPRPGCYGHGHQATAVPVEQLAAIVRRG